MDSPREGLHEWETAFQVEEEGALQGEGRLVHGEVLAEATQEARLVVALVVKQGALWGGLVEGKVEAQDTGVVGLGARPCECRAAQQSNA